MTSCALFAIVTHNIFIHPVHPITALLVAAASNANEITAVSDVAPADPGDRLGVVPPALALYPSDHELPNVPLLLVKPAGIVKPPDPATG